MYKVHQDATFLPVDVTTDDYELGAEKIPAVSVSASRDAQGRVHVSLVNLDPKAAALVDAKIEGQKFTTVTGRILTADTLDAHNTFDAPNRVQPTAFTGATLRDAALQVKLPPRSVVVLTLRVEQSSRTTGLKAFDGPVLGGRRPVEGEAAEEQLHSAEKDRIPVPQLPRATHRQR